MVFTEYQMARLYRGNPALALAASDLYIMDLGLFYL